jgi:hypothetical protein
MVKCAYDSGMEVSDRDFFSGTRWFYVPLLFVRTLIHCVLRKGTLYP